MVTHERGDRRIKKKLMSCFNNMTKKLQAEVKRLEEELSSTISKLGSVETKANDDREEYEKKLKGYSEEVERLVKVIEGIKESKDIPNLQRDLQEASNALKEVKKAAEEEKVAHNKTQNEKDKEVKSLKEAIRVLEKSAAEAQADLRTAQMKGNEERDKITQSLESLKEEFRVASARQAEKEQIEQLELSLKPDETSKDNLASCVILAKLLRTTDGAVLYSCSTLRCTVDDWEGSCDINEELVLPICRPRKVEDTTVQFSLLLQTKNSSRELLNLTFKPSVLDPFSQAHILARSGYRGNGKGSHAELSFTVAYEAPLTNLKEGNEQLLLEMKVTLPDAITAAILATYPNGEGGTPQPSFQAFFYDQSQSLTMFLKENVADLRLAGTAAPLVCITPGSIGTSIAPSWRGIPSSGTSAVPEFHPVAVGNVKLPRKGDSPPGGVKSCHVEFKPLVAPHLTAALEVDLRTWPMGAAGSIDDVGHSDEQVKGTNRGPARPSDDTVETVLAIARDREQVNAHLAKEYTRRAESLEQAKAEVSSLAKQLQAVKQENEELRSRIDEEKNMWDEATAGAGNSADPVLEAALSNLSSTQIVARLQETLNKYRTERAAVDELRRRLKGASEELARAQADRHRLEELERAHVSLAKQHQHLQERAAKLPKFEATIKSQEKIISKLELLLERSVKKTSKSSGILSELTRLKAANDMLNSEISDLKNKQKVKAEEQRRENENNREMIRAKDKEIKELLNAIRSEENREKMTAGKIAEFGSSMELRSEIAQLERTRDEFAERNKMMKSRIESLEAELLSNSRTYAREISALKIELMKTKVEASMSHERDNVA
ncbi:hypothetical protein FOL47_003023 [Perkinsus chesapeaki]|uniref:Uncharacterized protein n=1 Tax=Perkinsus chesapeaki TaxID=330153 RepID=A0A7J6MBP8_PERCH|nr:hypothetical protein FOL47_003023 [Perkinsus chesapeaki]